MCMCVCNEYVCVVSMSVEMRREGGRGRDGREEEDEGKQSRI